MIALSKQHRMRFNEIRQKLTSLGSKESVFVTIELLFYEALAIARTYGEDPGNNLLADLNQVYAEEYQATKEVFRKTFIFIPLGPGFLLFPPSPCLFPNNRELL